MAENNSENPNYNMAIVKAFAVCAVVYLVVGALVGDLIAWQLSFPALNFNEYMTFGRLRPLHTNAVIFA
ncbi:MAG: cbb3-type cytochrome c oxidase subunit I, partial [Mariprofundaceae bacterium]|nr:cbb3-type cytochrome c oxidase subunit I [Mariprofundaceae bacterium]